MVKKAVKWLKAHHYLRIGVVLIIVIVAIALSLSLKSDSINAASQTNQASDVGSCNQNCETLANDLLNTCKWLVGTPAIDCQKVAQETKNACQKNCTENGWGNGWGWSCSSTGLCPIDEICPKWSICPPLPSDGQCPCNPDWQICNTSDPDCGWWGWGWNGWTQGKCVNTVDCSALNWDTCMQYRGCVLDARQTRNGIEQCIDICSSVKDPVMCTEYYGCKFQ